LQQKDLVVTRDSWNYPKMEFHSVIDTQAAALRFLKKLPKIETGRKFGEAHQYI
jgi:hypothetical protein